MNHLTRYDYASALQLLARIEERAGDAQGFARAVVQALHDYIAAERTTLSVCDLATGHRQVVGLPGMGLGAQEIACFDLYFLEHSPPRQHGLDTGDPTWHVADPLARRDLPRSSPYGDEEQRMGLKYAIDVPLFQSPQTLVHLVLNRRVRDFDERDRERLNLLHPHLAFLYRHAHGLAPAPPEATAPAPGPDAGLPEPCSASCLTRREGLVMRWLACGKTNAEIAALLSISPRTVQKHLEHVYVKLGVETRTAAVMRTRADRARV